MPSPFFLLLMPLSVFDQTAFVQPCNLLNLKIMQRLHVLFINLSFRRFPPKFILKVWQKKSLAYLPPVISVYLPTSHCYAVVHFKTILQNHIHLKIAQYFLLDSNLRSTQIFQIRIQCLLTEVFTLTHKHGPPN